MPTFRPRPHRPVLTCRLTVVLIITAVFSAVTLLNLDLELQRPSLFIRKSRSQVPFEEKNSLASLNASVAAAALLSSPESATTAGSWSFPPAAAPAISSLTSAAREAAASLSASSTPTTETAALSPASSSSSLAAAYQFLDNGNSVSCWMTNVPDNDGWGSQWHRVLASIVIAATMNFNFAYTPMTKLEHLENPFDREKMHDMEVFAGLSSLRFITDIPSDIPRYDIIDVHQAICTEPALYTVKSANKFLDDYPHWWVEQRELLRKIYFSTPKPDLSKLFFANRTNVVAFQRRFNKLWDNRCSFHPNEYFIGVMETVRAKHPNSAFHVLSQSNMMQPFPNKECNNYKELSDEQFEDFEVFGNTSVHLDFSVQMALHMMVMSDVLITSQSSFSYAAAVHSIGHVYAIQFWHTALSDWHSCSYSYDKTIASCFQSSGFDIQVNNALLMFALLSSIAFF